MVIRNVTTVSYLIYQIVYKKIVFLQKLGKGKFTHLLQSTMSPYLNLFGILLVMVWVLRVTNLHGLPHSLLSYGDLILGECACMGHIWLIKKFFQGPSKGRYIPWAVPEDSGYWLNGVLRGWPANG